MSFLDKGFLAYGNEIVGIHAPQTRADNLELHSIYRLLADNHDVFRFAAILHGCRSFISKSTSLYKSDIDSFPLPKNLDSFNLSFWERAIIKDVLDYMTNYVRLGQNSQLLQKEAGRNDLLKYSNLFIKMLGTIYDNLKPSNPTFFNGLICQPFSFGAHVELEWLRENIQEELEKLIYCTEHERLRTIRVVRFYDKNVILIVKPSRLRYWIPSTAIKDADDTLTDLYRQGY